MNRQPHAVLDIPSRYKKAQKIEYLLGLDKITSALRLLEIGCGSGGIAHYFAHHPSGKFSVFAVDVIDQRVLTDGYDFQLVTDTTLPFPDEYFDVILSNHVIEHVGDTSAQLVLREISRVIKTNGVGYIASPNRWQLIEPHYRLIFLSWLPKPLRSHYLRLCRKGCDYDCQPLSLGELDSLLRKAGLRWQHLEVEAIHIMAKIEPNLALRIVQCFPSHFLQLLRPLIPTLICRVEKDNDHA